MTIAADLATVLALAVLTEDRAPVEQKAMERTAARLDADRNRFTSTNRRYDRSKPYLPCTFPRHWVNPAKCPICSVDREPHRFLLVPPFTDAARREPLTDEHGWSVALVAVKA